MLHQRLNGALGCRIGWDGPDNAACRERRDENNAASFRQDRQRLLDEKEGARTLTANSLSKSSMVVSSMVADFETPALATRMSSRSPTMSRASLASRCGPSAL
jgi:hypothetical protein